MSYWFEASPKYVIFKRVGEEELSSSSDKTTYVSVGGRDDVPDDRPRRGGGDGNRLGVSVWDKTTFAVAARRAAGARALRLSPLLSR